MNHGSHWQAVFGDIGEVLPLLQVSVQKGRFIHPLDAETGSPPALKPGDYALIRYPEALPIHVLAVIRGQEGTHECVSSYPAIADGAEQELEIVEVSPVDDEDADFQALITAINVDGVEIPFFEPRYGINKPQYARGGRFSFQLAAFAYSLQLAKTEIVIDKGPALEMEKARVAEEGGDPSAVTSVTFDASHMRCFFPHDEGDIEFQSVVESVEAFDFFGKQILKLRLFLRQPLEGAVPIDLFVGEKACKEFLPKPGDAIMGVAWLQGIPVKKVAAEESWLDSAGVAAKSSDFDGMLRAFAAEESLSSLPLAAMLLAQGFIAQGWEVELFENPLYDTNVPSFLALRRDERICVFVRSHVAGLTVPPDFPEEFQSENRTLSRASIEADAAFVTCRLEPAGDGYRPVFEGLDELEKKAGKLARMDYVQAKEKRKVLFVEDAAADIEPPDEPFDPAAAAGVFAQALANISLREFSKILTEDLEYSSELVEVNLRTREAFLSYFGALLKDWSQQGIIPVAKVAGDGHLLMLNSPDGTEYLEMRFFGCGRFVSRLEARKIS